MSQASDRPKKSETRQRQRVYGMRFNDAEIAELKRRAEAGGFQSPADMVRVRCLNARPLRPRLDIAHLLRVEAAINRVGNNVNQWAAVANLRNAVTADQLAGLLDALQEIHEAVDSLHDTRRARP